MIRELASIRRIDLIVPIPNANSIEKAIVGGWCSVVKKGEFKAGDLCVFIEIDTVLPKDNPNFSFMESRGYRVKPMTLRGVKSMGLVFPLSILPDVLGIHEGQDVAGILGVTRYEATIDYSLGGDNKGVFPYYIPKTDCERIQNLTSVVETYKDTSMSFTEKLDGTSATFYYKDGVFGACSRNMEKKETENCVYYSIVNALNLKEILKYIDKEAKGEGVALQGEIIGEKIQGNKYKIRGHRFYIFDLYFISERRYANFYELRKICKLGKGLDLVPHLFIVERLENLKVSINLQLDPSLLHTGNILIDGLVNWSKGVSVLNKEIQREGIVVKPLEEITGVDKIDRLVFKIINPDFKD